MLLVQAWEDAILTAKSIKNHYITQDCSNDPVELKGYLVPLGTDKQTKPKGARLQFSDSFLLNADELKDRGSMTEVKFENTIDRLTSRANPRQIERVVRGSVFAIKLVYDMEVEDEIIPDFENISQALKLLSMDYLGGHGSRGYGKVTFSDFKIEVKSGNCPVDIEKLMQLLGGVEEYGIFTVQA